MAKRSGKRTIATVGSKFSEAFTPNWDAKAGPMQHRDRLDARQAMGQKMTPPGRSRLRPAGHK